MLTKQRIARGIWYLALTVTVLAFGTTSARADVVFEQTFFLDGPLGNTDEEAAFIEDYLGLDPGTLSFLFKAEAPDTVDGDIDVDFDDDSATISWDLTGTGFELNWILLKDGNVQPLGHLYTLYGVTDDQVLTSNGDQTVEFIDPDTGDPIDRGISHISFFGTPHEAPEPTTLLLLGTGLAGLGAFLRRKR
jgi:hypothetical protein